MEKQFDEKKMKARKLKTAFISVIILGLMAHLYCWIDYNYSHDSALTFIQTDGIWQVSIGRYLQPLYVLIRGELYSPVVIGALSLLFLGISTYYLTEIFEINKTSGIVLTAGVLSTNSVITFSSATYIYLLDIYMFALMCSIIAVYLCKKYKYGWIASVFLLTISMGLYQSYWQVGIAVLLFTLIFDILKNEKFKKIFMKALKYLAVLLGSCVLYYVGNKIALAYYHVTPADSYNSITALKDLIHFENIMGLVKGTYKYVINFFINPKIFHVGLVRITSIISFVFSLVMIIWISLKNNIKLLNWILLILLLILIPLGGNIVYIIAQGTEHDLMVYSFFISYIYLLALCELAKNEKTKIFVRSYEITAICCVSILVFNSIIFSNQIYVKKRAEFKFTYSTFERIIGRIESIDNYDIGSTKVIFIGELYHNNITSNKPYFNYSGTGNEGNHSVTYMATYSSFINNIMQYPMNIVMDEAIINDYKNNKEVVEMKKFPSKDCVKMIDDTVIVKLS